MSKRCKSHFSLILAKNVKFWSKMFTDFFIKTSTFATALQPEFIINLINVTIMKRILLTLLLMMAAMAASAFDQGDFQYVVTSDSTVTLNGFKTSYTGSSTTLYIPGYTYDASTQKYYRVTKIAWGAFNPNIRTSFATQLRAITRVRLGQVSRNLTPPCSTTAPV